MRSSTKGLLLATVLIVGVLGTYLVTTLTFTEELVNVTLTIPATTMHFLWAYAGVEAGIYAEEGIDLEILVVLPPHLGVQAVIEGSAHFTAIAESGAVAMLRGADLKIVAYDFSDLRFHLVTRPEVRGFEDLRRGVLAVDRAYSMSTSLTREILQSHGLNPDTDVEITGVGSPDERLRLLEQGSVDAAILAPPYTIFAEESGLRLLVESSEVVPRRIIGFLATSRQMIQEKPDTVRKMVKATVRSIKYVIEQSEEAIALAVEVFDIGEDWVREYYDLVKPTWGYRVPPEDVIDLFEVQNSFLEEPVEFDVHQWIDHTFLNEVLWELGEEPLSAFQASQTHTEVLSIPASDVER